MEICMCKSVIECENFKIPHQFAKHRQSLSWLWHQVTIPKWKFLGQKWYHKFRDMISVVKTEKTVLMFLELGVTHVIQKWKFSYCLKCMKYGGSISVIGLQKAFVRYGTKLWHLSSKFVNIHMYSYVHVSAISYPSSECKKLTSNLYTHQHQVP